MSNSATLDQIQLRWDDFRWCGKFDIPLMGQESNPETPIDVLSKDEQPVEPCAEQVAAWRRFVERDDIIFKAILEAGFAYYNEIRPDLETLGPEWVEDMPEISKPSQLIEMIELSSITVTWPYHERPVRIGVQFGCDWDEEHGFGVVLEGVNVIDVGGADCAIL